MIITNFEQLNSVDTKTAVALGKFEGLHLGHRLLIDRAVEYGREHGVSSLIFTMTQSEVKRIYTKAERAAILEALGVMQDVECNLTPGFMAFSPEDFAKQVLVDRLKAACVFVGEDFRFGAKRAGDVNLLRTLGAHFGFTVEVFSKLKQNGTEVSSTEIKNRLEAGDLSGAQEMLGRPYIISGEVVTGKRLGRTIGFPTLNLEPGAEKFLPKPGAYATEVNVDGKTYKAVTNIGSNPTVESGNQLKVESHLINFSDNAYGKNITVTFLKFIRPEMKFDSINELKKQINSDIISIGV